MDNNEIYTLLLPELRKLLHWCKFPETKYEYAFDGKLAELLDPFNLTLRFGCLYGIFLLADNLCDSIGHDFKDLRLGYSTVNGINDLELIIDYIEKNDIKGMEYNFELRRRLRKLYRG